MKDRLKDKTPQRRCLATGDVKPSSELLRFVLGPDGVVVFDVNGKLPGRGLWLSARQDVLKTAARKNLFAKAAKSRATLLEDWDDRVAWLLRNQCLNRVGLARRAGNLTQGFEKVRAALKAHQTGVLIEASDAARDGREKIQRMAPDLAVVALFTAEQIGHAIGRNNAVHALLAPGKLADIFLQDARKLAGVLGTFGIKIDGRWQETNTTRDGAT